jgi:hypothetical protein
MRHDIEELKRRLPLPELMQRLGCGEHAKKSAFCPFHENTQSPAFSIWQNERGWHWKCHNSCGSGDEIDFIQKAFQTSQKDAFERYRQHAGGPSASYHAPSKAIKPQAGLTLPDDFRPGSEEELECVAKLRKVDVRALSCMRHFGVLGFGTVCGVPCWIVTDASGFVAEARRLDGGLFPALHQLGERKAHTLRGSSKRWPVGLALPKGLTEKFQKTLLLEGSGDLVAGYHFALNALNGQGWLPIAMLGASIKLMPKAIDALRGKYVRIVPHQDNNNAGQDAEKEWRQALIDAGLRGSTFSLQGLRQHDGRPVNDLNDCVNIHAGDEDQLGGLFE